MCAADTLFLIVDDASLMRTIVKTALAELGHSRFVEAIDRLTALKLLEKHAAKEMLRDIRIYKHSFSKSPS